jgi:hypothetical protein
MNYQLDQHFFNAIDLIVELPETFNEDNNIVLLDNVVNPDTFNDGTNVELLINEVKPLTFIDDTNVELLFNVVNLIHFMMIIM